jgi:aconitate hydratase
LESITKAGNLDCLTDELDVGGRRYRYANLTRYGTSLLRLPVSLKILAENTLRWAPAATDAFESWLKSNGRTEMEVEFRPTRVLMHDTTCVPALVDFAAMRDAIVQLGSNPARVNPKIPVDLVVDHSVIVDFAGSANAFSLNLNRDFERNGERYAFIRWAQKNLANFRVIPPATGIIHQVNLEHLSEVVRVQSESDALSLLVPDTLVGTDSHTPMVNALGILAWGVGGLEGEAAALGQPLSIRIPEVVGIRLSGRLRPGVTATDLALTLTELLRRRSVVEKIVEFFGSGVSSLSVADRATVSNMAPEYGATCSLFPIDMRTVDYLQLIGRSEHHLAIVEAYARAQGMWHLAEKSPVFTEILDFDLGAVETSLAGPKRPQDRLGLSEVRDSFFAILAENAVDKGIRPRTASVPGKNYDLQDGAVLIAAITSCTNTSNPALMIGAGLLARKARQAGLRVPAWVKTSFSPGSHAVSDYLQRAGLQKDLDALGFQLTGYGCMTCIGNSGGLDEAITRLTDTQAIVGAAVLSGNRNFEGRINPCVRASYLASPAMVVAYALAGSVLTDLRRDPVARSPLGIPIHLGQLWPTDEEIEGILRQVVTKEVFRTRAGTAFDGPREWQEIEGSVGITFPWRQDSTYLRRPPYFEGMTGCPSGFIDIIGAKALLILGDSVTTDHISPAGAIPVDSLAGAYLTDHQVPLSQFNQYSTRRGNHEVMLRGIFSNPRLQNELLNSVGIRGGKTRMQPDGPILSIYEAALRFRTAGTPLLIFAGKEYGTGSSRDWAAKGPALLGVRAVIAESFERIHRTNLLGMGILPLQFTHGCNRHTLKLDGSESFHLTGLTHGATPLQTVTLEVCRSNGSKESTGLVLRAETGREIEHLRHGGLLKHVLRDLLDDG